jgi:hypothetical protein
MLQGPSHSSTHICFLNNLGLVWMVHTSRPQHLGAMFNIVVYLYGTNHHGQQAVTTGTCCSPGLCTDSTPAAPHSAAAL